MKITDIRIRLIKKDDTKLKAVASITLDNAFVVHDIKIIEGSNGCFVAMPSRKTNEGEYKDIVHPINQETRDFLINSVIKAYEQEVLTSANETL